MLWFRATLLYSATTSFMLHKLISLSLLLARFQKWNFFSSYAVKSPHSGAHEVAVFTQARASILSLYKGILQWGISFLMNRASSGSFWLIRKWLYSWDRLGKHFISKALYFKLPILMPRNFTATRSRLIVHSWCFSILFNAWPGQTPQPASSFYLIGRSNFMTPEMPLLFDAHIQRYLFRAFEAKRRYRFHIASFEPSSRHLIFAAAWYYFGCQEILM